jgi:hypothetical protein
MEPHRAHRATVVSVSRTSEVDDLLSRMQVGGSSPRVGAELWRRPERRRTVLDGQSMRT